MHPLMHRPRPHLYLYKEEKKMSCKKFLGFGLSLLIGIQAIGIGPAIAAQKQLRMPDHLPTPAPKRKITYTPDLLLIMPNKTADPDDLKQALEDVHGTVIGSMGEGPLKCLIVKTEKGKLEETEKKLKGDKKDFACIGRNYQVPAEFVPNDPSFASEWHLGAVDAPKAWDHTTGSGTTIGILDSGCQASNTDLSGKTRKGFDATSFGAHLMGGFFAPGDPLGFGVALGAEASSSGAQADVHGHGTWVATSAAATANNGFATAGVAPGATVYPIRIANSSGMTDPLSIQAALLVAMAKGIRIVNISYGFYPPFGFTDPGIYPTMHAYFAFFHDVYGGLIFMSAGNDGTFDPDPQQHYYNIVSAVDNTLSLTNFSNYGTSITFTAPGKGIVVSDRGNNPASVDGTSFSSPIVAGIAALVWNANPALPNVAVESILKASCFTTGGGGWTPYYGFGMPDADKAVRMASGL
jgi:thermitase